MVSCFLLHLLRTYTYTSVSSWTVTNTTTFVMELCGHKQSTAHAHVRPHCVWLNFEHTKNCRSRKQFSRRRKSNSNLLINSKNLRNGSNLFWRGWYCSTRTSTTFSAEWAVPVTACEHRLKFCVSSLLDNRARGATCWFSWTNTFSCHQYSARLQKLNHTKAGRGRRFARHRLSSVHLSCQGELPCGTLRATEQYGTTDDPIIKRAEKTPHMEVVASNLRGSERQQLKSVKMWLFPAVAVNGLQYPARSRGVSLRRHPCLETIWMQKIATSRGPTSTMQVTLLTKHTCFRLACGGWGWFVLMWSWVSSFVKTESSTHFSPSLQHSTVHLPRVCEQTFAKMTELTHTRRAHDFSDVGVVQLSLGRANLWTKPLRPHFRRVATSTICQSGQEDALLDPCVPRPSPASSLLSTSNLKNTACALMHVSVICWRPVASMLTTSLQTPEIAGSP